MSAEKRVLMTKKCKNKRKRRQKKEKGKKKLKIMHANVRGIKSKIVDIVSLAEEIDLDIMILT